MSLNADGSEARFTASEPLAADQGAASLTVSTPAAMTDLLRHVDGPLLSLDGDRTVVVPIDPPLKSGTHWIELLEFADANGNLNGGHSRAFPLDSAAPEIASARTSSLMTTVVTLDEAVGGTLRAADWAIADDDDGDANTDEARAVLSVRAGAHSEAEAAGSYQTSVEVSSATQVTITHEGLASSSSTPEVSYARPVSLGTGESYLTDSDAHPGPYRLDSHPVPAKAAVGDIPATIAEPTPHATDGLSPMVMSLTVSVTDMGQAAARTGIDSQHANGGDTIVVSLTLDEDAALMAGAPMIKVPADASARADGEPRAVAMANAGDADDATWSHTIVVDADRDDEGSLTFTIAVTDASTGMNMAMLSQADITSGGTAVIDVTAPRLEHARFASTTEIIVTFSEHMGGTDAEIVALSYSVEDADGNSVLDAMATPAYAEQEVTSTITFTLSQAAAAENGDTYEVEVPAALTDRADNALVTRTADANYSEPALASARTEMHNSQV